MATSQLMTADDPAALSQFGSPRWGIFGANGSAILTVDSVASVEYARDYHISDYPQEQGAFQSYNKVQVPFQSKIGFLIAQSRVAFLQGIEAAVASLSLVSVVTPEIIYPNANLVHYGYRREQRNGVTLIRVEVWCEEIRTAGTTASNSAAPTISGGASGGIGEEGDAAGDLASNSGASPYNGGSVQPAQATVSGDATLAGSAGTTTTATGGASVVTFDGGASGASGTPGFGTADTDWVSPANISYSVAPAGAGATGESFTVGPNGLVPLGSQGAINPAPSTSGGP